MLTRPEGPRPRPRPGLSRPRPRPRPGPSRPRPGPSRPRPRPRPEQWTLKAESRPTRSRTSSTNILNIDYCFLKLLWNDCQVFVVCTRYPYLCAYYCFDMLRWATWRHPASKNIAPINLKSFALWEWPV